MGWLVGLPLGLFRLLGEYFCWWRCGLRCPFSFRGGDLGGAALRRRSARYRAEDEDRQEPKFHGPVYGGL